MSLDLDTKPLLYMQKLFNSVHDQDLPFLVVTASNDGSARNKEDLLGYAYVRILAVPFSSLGPNLSLETCLGSSCSVDMFQGSTIIIQ